jgi:hypothetical protein
MWFFLLVIDGDCFGANYLSELRSLLYALMLTGVRIVVLELLFCVLFNHCVISVFISVSLSAVVSVGNIVVTSVL